MTQRHVPRPRELSELVRLRAPAVRHRRQRQVAEAPTVWDLREIAQRRAPRVVFDYADGGADEEIAVRRARQTYRDVELRPRVLRDVGEVCTTTQVLGRETSLPFGIAPTGFTRLMHTEGERAGAAAAAGAGIPFTLSTMGTASIEEVATINPGRARPWFQLYLWKDRTRSADLIARAAAVGVDTLVLTVDVPVGGRRLRDVRSGMSVPPSLTLGSALDAATHPSWWFDFATTEPLSFAALDRDVGQVKALFRDMFDPSVTFDDLAWVRDRWEGHLVVKGVQTVEDALLLTESGVDAIVLSNHGGRQLDRATNPLRALVDVREALPDEGPEIWVDSGITSGTDIVTALALGANFTLIGRSYLYGLMAGGKAGADRTIAILRDEIERTMRLLGVTDLRDLGPQHVQLYSNQK